MTPNFNKKKIPISNGKCCFGSNKGGTGGRGCGNSEASSQAKDQVEGRLLLDVVVGQRPSVLELLAGEDETLLVWGNAFLVLDFGLDILDRVGGLDLEGDCLSGQGFDKNLHASSQPENQVKGGLLLDVVI